jgi:signal transduction histidine kinase
MRAAWTRAGGAAAAALAALALATLAASQETEPRPHVIEQADFVFSDSNIPPGTEAPWRPVRLPDNWYVSHPGETRVGWYRLAFDLPHPEQNRIHGLYLPRNSAGRLRFFINGHFHSGNLGYGAPGTRGWAPPLVGVVSPALLKAGRNEIHVQVTAVADLREGLTRVVVGRAPVTRNLYESRYAEQVSSLFMFGAAALLSGLLAGALWLRQRNDATLLWFAVTALAWAAAAFPWVHVSLAPTALSHGMLAFAGRFCYAAPMLVLGLRVAGRRWPRAEAALWTFTATGLALSGFVSDAHQAAVITIWSAAYLAALAALLPVLVRARADRSPSLWVLAAALAVAVLLNAHDLAWWAAWIDYDSVQLAHFHVPLVLIAIGATIVDRHFRAVAAVEQANAVLEQRVADKTREIEASFERLREAEREKALARERQRIMADMHDGLGSSLVGLLGAVQSRRSSLEDVERRLLDALQELRMSVDALEPVDGDLAAVLGNVRHRMRTAIEDSGVKLHWQVDDLPPMSNLTPQAILAVQRIVSEALANALRHAQARAVTVSARADEDCLRVQIVDDGVGFAEPAPPGGRGLDNLRHRAAALGATLEVRSEPGSGTSVALQLPLRLPAMEVSRPPPM